ncbi:MAG: DUF2892 domain-containing protein [Alphaproteobacteria bacterium]
MKTNIGVIDRSLRLIIGALLVAWALPVGFPPMNYNWIGWVGILPVITALVGYCPLYGFLDLTTNGRPRLHA